MNYRVNEIFHSLQGEGAHSGQAAVFCRFSGCNLACPFCDTEHTSGTTYSSPDTLTQAILDAFPPTPPHMPRHVILTGGEPALQLDPGLITSLKTHNLTLAVETNGTLPLPPGLDWITVSPKADSTLHLRSGHELKLVWPQPGLHLEDYETLDFRHFFLQPRDGYPDAMTITINQCLNRPLWRLSPQIHKLLSFK